VKHHGGQELRVGPPGLLPLFEKLALRHGRVENLEPRGPSGTPPRISTRRPRAPGRDAQRAPRRLDLFGL
jgi:hypothetical protein